MGEEITRKIRGVIIRALIEGELRQASEKKRGVGRGYDGVGRKEKPKGN